MQYRKITDLYSKDHTEHINTEYGEKAVFNVKEYGT
jgi:hypothetical protein